MEIEANFSATVYHLKYRERQIQNKERKRQQLVNEFIYGTCVPYLAKHGLALEALEEHKASLLGQFESFKERRPEPLDIYISKFNTQSLKTIYRKYLAYLRYLVFQEVREYRDMHERFERHFSILTEERHLRDVFNLYSMSFDDKN